MEIKGILFDKDGTIIDFYEVWGTAAEPVLEWILEKYGLDGNRKLKEKLLEALGVHGQVIDSEGALAWKPYDLIAKDLEKIFLQENISISCTELKENLIDGFYEEVCAKRQEYPVFTDMKKLMSKLHQMGIRIGLATTDEYESTKVCMEKIGISKWISFYGTAGLGYPEKPDGELIVMAAKEWGIQSEEVAVIGDTPNDMRFARNGNAVGIGVLSGTGKREDLEPLAHYVIHSVDELLNLLEEIWQR